MIGQKRLQPGGKDDLHLINIKGIPFTNNQGKNNLHMTKVQQKISSYFCSMEGAAIF